MSKIIFALAILGMFTTASWADIYEGVIVESLDGGQLLEVAQVDDLTKDKKTLFVSLDTETQILSADSAAALKPGDSVSINAVETEPNRLSAKSITVSGQKAKKVSQDRELFVS